MTTATNPGAQSQRGGGIFRFLSSLVVMALIGLIALLVNMSGPSTNTANAGTSVDDGAKPPPAEPATDSDSAATNPAGDASPQPHPVSARHIWEGASDDDRELRLQTFMATQAMQSLIEASNGEPSATAIASQAWDIAEAMMAERARRGLVATSPQNGERDADDGDASESE